MHREKSAIKSDGKAIKFDLFLRIFVPTQFTANIYDFSNFIF